MAAVGPPPPPPVQLPQLFLDSLPYCSVKSHKSCECFASTTPSAGLCDTTPIATPISPCRIDDAAVEGCVTCPFGGVVGKALVGGGPGLGISPARGLCGRAGALTTLSELLVAVAEMMEAVVVGLLEKLFRLPSAVTLVTHPRGDIGGDPLLLVMRSDLGTSLLIVGAKRGEAGKPGRGVREWPAEDGRLLTPTSSILRSLRGGGGVRGTPSGPVTVCEIVGETRGVGDSAWAGDPSRFRSWPKVRRR